MCCILALAMFFSSRLAIFVGWITGWYGAAYESTIWPLLGFLFMPWTALCYAAKVRCDGGGAWTFLMILAVLADLGTWGASSSNKKKEEA